MHTCLARRSGGEYLRGELGGQGGSFDLPRVRGLPCEAWINLTAPVVKGGAVYANLFHVFSYKISPRCCLWSVFRQWTWLGQVQRSRSRQGSAGKPPRRGMLIPEELTACLRVFLGRHSGLGWDMRRPAGRLGVYQSAPAVLGELSCVPTLVPTKSSTFLAGPALGILEVPVMLRCPWLQLWLLLWSQVCLFASFHQPTSRLAAFLPPDLVWENPGVHRRYDVVPACSPVGTPPGQPRPGWLKLSPGHL